MKPERLRMDECRFESIVAESPSMKAVVAKARHVSSAGLRVILQGPTGTGKELLARAIHWNGARTGKPFFPVNCGAIPAALAESELFGHERGAFTGAGRRKRGWFELAHGGTLFLDEIPSLSPELQSKLLRVLQDGRFLRMGGEDWIQVDVHVLAASNKNLRQLVEQGKFRDDLFYRLGAVLIEIPALLERPEDVPALLRHFLGRWSAKYGKKLRGYSHAAWEFLTAYSWPGNVRQMELVVESLVAMADGDEIDLAHFPSEILAIGHPESDPSRLSQSANEHRRILDVLSEVAGNRTRAAEILGISRPTLRARMAAYGIALKIVGPGSTPTFRVLPKVR